MWFNLWRRQLSQWCVWSAIRLKSMSYIQIQTEQNYVGWCIATLITYSSTRWTRTRSPVCVPPNTVCCCGCGIDSRRVDLDGAGRVKEGVVGNIIHWCVSHVWVARELHNHSQPHVTFSWSRCSLHWVSFIIISDSFLIRYSSARACCSSTHSLSIGEKVNEYKLIANSLQWRSFR